MRHELVVGFELGDGHLTSVGGGVGGEVERWPPGGGERRDTWLTVLTRWLLICLVVNNVGVIFTGLYSDSEGITLTSSLFVTGIVLDSCPPLSVNPSFLSTPAAHGDRGLRPSSSRAAQEEVTTETRGNLQRAAEGSGSEVSRCVCVCELFLWP